MELSYLSLSMLAAFGLGACPFSVWIGRWFLGKDIRDYGDGNPGAANVFRAGSSKLGLLAVILDVAKGFPFVFLAHAFFELPDAAVLLVAMSAILGHAFSPLLQLRGGKAIAVTFGALLALPQHEIVVVFAALTLLGFLFIEVNAWAVILGAVGSLAFILVIRGGSWEALFLLGLLVLMVVKHFEELKTAPRIKVKIRAWLQSRGREP
ncbi:MAG TPA: glycerol-3-phosphate acyltransferase [Dehalococcoidia bacterium]|nr:glycerol-3-phosphate acyltransferase [Dehalococcoidia bacterium]